MKQISRIKYKRVFIYGYFLNFMFKTRILQDISFCYEWPRLFIDEMRES